MVHITACPVGRYYSLWWMSGIFWPSLYLWDIRYKKTLSFIFLNRGLKISIVRRNSLRSDSLISQAVTKCSSSSIVWQTVQIRRWLVIFRLAWRPRSISNLCEIVRSVAIAVGYRSSNTLCKSFFWFKIVSKTFDTFSISAYFQS